MEQADELVGNCPTATSGAWRSRLHGAQPKLLMLDEPTQGMSPAETAEIDALIKSLAGGVTVLLIEHDIELVMSISDHVIVMHQGGKLSKGRPMRCGQAPPCARPTWGPTMPLLEVEQLHARYDYAPVLQGVSFTVDAGQIVSIFGRNGPARPPCCAPSWLAPSLAGRVGFAGESIGAVARSHLPAALPSSPRTADLPDAQRRGNRRSACSAGGACRRASAVAVSNGSSDCSHAWESGAASSGRPCQAASSRCSRSDAP